MMTDKEKIEFLHRHGLEIMIMNHSNGTTEILGLICMLEDEKSEDFMYWIAITAEGFQQAIEKDADLPYTEALLGRSGILVYKHQIGESVNSAIKLEGIERRRICEIFIKRCEKERELIN